MNVYCRNNPVNYVDYSGGIVFSVGSSVDATFGFGECVSVNYLIDDNGNIAKQLTYVNYANEDCYVGALDVGASKTFSIIWDADTVYDLENDTLTIGASAGDVVSFGIDLIELEENDVINGFSISVGVGAGVDIHEYTSTTQTVWSYNINNIFSENSTSSRIPNNRTTGQKTNTSLIKKNATIRKICRYCGRPIGNNSWECRGGWN